MKKILKIIFLCKTCLILSNAKAFALTDYSKDINWLAKPNENKYSADGEFFFSVCILQHKN